MKTSTQKVLYISSSFIAGFSIMVVELISSRIVAPIIGSSVFTWTSVIGITLLGLSIGSFIGGKIADKTERREPLPLAFLISAILVFIITILIRNTDFITGSSTSILKLNLLISSYLFLLPAISIGTIQPMILKRFANDFSKIGSEYGALSAIWSLGSILGVFLTGFFFVSTIGSLETIWLVSIILFLTGLALAIGNKKDLVFFLITIVILIIYIFIPSSTNKKTSLIFQKETNYYTARITDSYLVGFGESRMLFLDFDSHSIQPTETSKYFYPEMYPIFSDIKSDIKDILVIGAGAYTMPKYFKDYYKNANVSVIEMDPEMEKIGKDYFGLDKYDIKTITGDARVIVSKDVQKYDVIFGDAYNSFISVPWYLLTKEWNSSIKEKLNDSGIYAINFIGSMTGPGSDFVKSVLNTFKITFPNFYIFSFGLDLESVQNIVLVGLKGDLPISEKDLYQKILKGKNSFLAERIIPAKLFINSTSTILTDNFSPVEKLMAPIIEGYFPKNVSFIKSFF